MSTLLNRFLLPLCALITGAAYAQHYPVKPVRVMIPWPPGGSNDVVGRIVAQKLSEYTGQQFVVENRGGASGTIGSDLFAKSDPDGYNVMIHSATHVANPHLYKKLPYNTLNDFIGITPLARQVGMLVVHPSMPVKTLKEFIALARSRSGQIVYASAGNGSYVHLTMALFAKMAKLDMVHVPYKGGGPAALALASGETHAMLATIGGMTSHLNGGRIRPIAVSSDERVSQYPHIPTIAEAGVPGYEFTAWISAFVPARTPDPIVKHLNALMIKAVADSTVAKVLSAQVLDPMPMTPEQFAKRLKSDYEKYGQVIQASGAQID